MRNVIDNALLGKRLYEARINRNMSQEDLGKKTGLVKSTISRYEKGQIASPKLPTIESFARALNVDEAWLMGYDVPMERKKEKFSGAKFATPYYLDDEAAAIAQEMHDRPELKVLFDASRKVSAKDLQFVIDMLDRFKNEE